MKEDIWHGKCHTNIENGILKYLISSTYCVFLNYKRTRNLKQKLNTKLKKIKNTNHKMSFDNYKETRNLKQKLKTLYLA